MISFYHRFQVKKRNFDGNWYKQTNANNLDNMSLTVEGFIEKYFVFRLSRITYPRPNILEYRLVLYSLVVPLNDEEFLSGLRDLLLMASNWPEKQVKFKSSV